MGLYVGRALIPRRWIGGALFAFAALLSCALWVKLILALLDGVFPVAR